MASTTTPTAAEVGYILATQKERPTSHVMQLLRMYAMQKAGAEKELAARQHMHGVWTTLYHSAPGGPELRAMFLKQAISNLEGMAKLRNWLQAYEERFGENGAEPEPVQSRLPKVTTVENDRRPKKPKTKTKTKTRRVNEQALASITLIR